MNIYRARGFPSSPRANINCLSPSETQPSSLHSVTEKHLRAQSQSLGAFKTHITRMSRWIKRVWGERKGMQNESQNQQFNLLQHDAFVGEKKSATPPPPPPPANLSLEMREKWDRRENQRDKVSYLMASFMGVAYPGCCRVL